MNLSRLPGIVYNKMKSVQADDMMIYQPVPPPIDKIKNKYRLRMIVKCKINSKILDKIKYSIEDEKLNQMKNTTIIVDINPNNMM